MNYEAMKQESDRLRNLTHDELGAEVGINSFEPMFLAKAKIAVYVSSQITLAGAKTDEQTNIKADVESDNYTFAVGVGFRYNRRRIRFCPAHGSSSHSSLAYLFAS